MVVDYSAKAYHFLMGRTFYFDAAVLCFLFAALGWIGGVPFDHPDFVLPYALSVIKNYGNPQGFFSYPGFMIHLNAIVYGCVFLVEKLFCFCGTGEWTHGFALLSSPFRYFPGHFLTVLFSALGGLGTYFTAYELSQKRAPAFLAALFVLTSLLWIADSHFLTVDIPVASLIILTTYAAVRIGRNKTIRFRELFLLGFMAGLSTATKYTGILTLAPILAMLAARHHRNRYRLVFDGILLVIISAAVFLMINPYVILDFRAFRSDVLCEWCHSRNGHFGYHVSSGAYIYHLTNSLSYGYGLIPLLFALLGIIGLLRCRTMPRSTKLIMMLFPLLYFAAIGRSTLTFQRYALPLIPFLGVYSSLGVYDFYRAISSNQIAKSRFLKTGLLISLGAVLSFSFLRNSQAVIRHDVLLGRTDTRSGLPHILKELLSQNPNLRIRKDQYSVRYMPQVNPSPAGEKSKTTGPPIELIILDSFSHDRYLYDAHPVGRRLPFLEAFSPSGYVVQISPFRLPKDSVPFSPKSLYSPYLPDMKYRENPGPFIEIYCKNAFIARQIAEFYNKLGGIRVALLEAGKGYYFQRSAPPDAVR